MKKITWMIHYVRWIYILAEFDGENFSFPDKLKTEEDYMGSGNINSVYEMMYSVGVNEDQLCYAWVENTENSYFLSEGSNSIYRVKDVGGRCC